MNDVILWFNAVNDGNKEQIYSVLIVFALFKLMINRLYFYIILKLPR